MGKVSKDYNNGIYRKLKFLFQSRNLLRKLCDYFCVVQVSQAIMDEDIEESKAEREIDEIDEQM